MKIKTIKIYQALFAGALTCLIAASCNQAPAPVTETPAEPAKPSQEEMIARGAYLVGVGGCNDCHTPKIFGPEGPKLDMDRMLSGHPADAPVGEYDAKTLSNWMLMAPGLTAAVGPWGTSFAANLTSDETGIGNWTLEQFTKALREGKFMGQDGGRMILPPMPWEGLGATLTDEDLEAIFMYLKSTKPVNNIPPNPIPPAGA